MVPDAENIRPTPRVQVVMHMDGWGPPWLKFDSYRDYIVNHPVQYTGFKLFYHNDTKRAASRCSRNSKCCNCCRIRCISSISNPCLPGARRVKSRVKAGRI